VSRKTCILAYLSLAPDDEIVQIFAKMGKNVDQDFQTLFQVDMPDCLKGTTHYKGLCAGFIQLRVT